MAFEDNDFSKMSKPEIIQIWEVMPHTQAFIESELGRAWKKKSKKELVKTLIRYPHIFEKDYNPFQNVERHFY